METLPPRKLKRLESKKKKIVALLEIGKLNDQDKQDRLDMDSSSKKCQSPNGPSQTEPSSKRQKANDGSSLPSRCQSRLWSRSHPLSTRPELQASQQWIPFLNFHQPHTLNRSYLKRPLHFVQYPHPVVLNRVIHPHLGNFVNHASNIVFEQPLQFTLGYPIFVAHHPNLNHGLNLVAQGYLARHLGALLPLTNFNPFVGYHTLHWPHSMCYTTSASASAVPPISPHPSQQFLFLTKSTVQHENIGNGLKSENDVNETNGDPARPKFSEQELNELRKQLKERTRALKATPLFRLKEPSGFQSLLSTPAFDRSPLFLSDLQHLIMFIFLTRNSYYVPRWCHLERVSHVSAVNLLFIEGAGLSDYNQSSEKLDALSESKFPFQMEVIMPAAYCGNLVEEFSAVPLTSKQRANLHNAYGTLDNAVKLSGEVFKVMRAVFPIPHKPDRFDVPLEPTVENPLKVSYDGAEESASKDPPEESLPPTDKFPRTQLLLSAWQMIEEGYPVPINAAMREKYKDFVMSKDVYKEVGSHSPMYGVDCEMCLTIIGRNECTRVSIVNEKLETVLDTLVMPPNRIINYLTQFSGITKAMMKGVTTTLEDVQNFIKEKLEPDAILVGQSLNSDLLALKMMHPYIIDTSVVFNITGNRYRKSKLKVLTEQFLKEEIQTGSDGHCSVEDSAASLRLVQLKLANSIEFGDKVLSSYFPQLLERRSIHEEDYNAFGTSLFSYIRQMEKDTLIVGCPDVVEDYVEYLNPKATIFQQVDSSGCVSSVDNDKSARDHRVECLIAPTNDMTVSETVKRVNSNAFSIAHVRLSEKEKDKLASRQKDMIKRVNKWTSDLYEATPLNGLCVVVFCGLEKSSNGVCFVALRKQDHKKFRFVPPSPTT